MIDGQHKGVKIKFHNTDPIRLVNPQGLESFSFRKDGTIILPGINTGNLEASWSSEGDKITFQLWDKPHRKWHAAKDSLITNSLSATMDSLSNKLAIDPDFEYAREVYERTFTYVIMRDTLVLWSDRTALRAVGDHTIDNLLKPIKPK